MNAEQRILELGITLPGAAAPRAMYVPVKRAGNMLYVSGQLPADNDGTLCTGRLGIERDVAYGQKAARLCAINILAALKNELGDLDLVRNIVKLQVFVSSEEGFTQQHIVANAASELFFEVFGDAGRHARSAVGTAWLPLGVTVEIDAVVEAHPDAS